MKPDFIPTVYFQASRRNGTVYTGVTSNLAVRVAQHRDGTFAGFTRKHGIKLLVWFEPHETMEQAILREKRIKKWLRDWKLDLIEAGNPDWRDLAEDFGFSALAESILLRWVPAFAGMTRRVLPSHLGRISFVHGIAELGDA